MAALAVVGACGEAVDTAAVAAEQQSNASPSFVRASGTGFILDGRSHGVAGVNNHYLSYGSADEVRRVLDDAKAMHANVVRTFNHPVIGSLDGTTKPTIWNFHRRADASSLGVNGVYMLYWDTAERRMQFNDGPDGIAHLDFLLAEARKRDLKLIIGILDFWDYTGGAQQMRAWYGSTDKNTFFFEDTRVKQDFKDWIRHLLTRVNPLTGVAYKDDPTIFAWELMNEPNAATDAMFLAWVREMGQFVKSIDQNHLLSSGHANVTNRISDAGIASIDYLTWHGYPLYYNLTVETCDRKIGEFCEIGRSVGKPVLLEEFGYARSNPDQTQAYVKWLATIHDNQDCAGWLVWRLVSLQDHGRYPIDRHDQFDIHRDGKATWMALESAAVGLQRRGASAPSSGRDEIGK